MQNGKKEKQRGTTETGPGRTRDHLQHCDVDGRLHRTTSSFSFRSFSLCIILSIFAFGGCGSRGGPPFTDRATEDNRAKRIQVLRKETREHPRDPRLWKQLGMELLKESESLVGTYSGFGYWWFAMIKWRHAERTMDEAISAFEKSIALDSTDAALFALAGRTLLAKFHSDPLVNDTTTLTRAISSFERSIQLRPLSVDALVYLGIAWTPSWRSEGNLERAINYIGHALSLRPDDGMVHHALSMLFEAEDNYDRSIEEARIALDLGPADETAYLELSDRYQRMFRDRQRQADESVDSAASSIARVVAGVARPFYVLSMPLPHFFDIGVCRKADALGLRNPFFYSRLAFLYATFGREEKGFNFLLRAFELDSLHLGLHWPWLGYRDSISMDRFLASIAPGSYYGLILAASMRENPGGRSPRSEAAKRLLQRATQLQPTYGAAYVRLGDTHLRLGENRKAVELFRKALSLEFHEASSMLLATEDLLGQKEFDLALRYYKRLLDLDLVPRIVVLKEMGNVLALKGDRRAAYAIYREIDRQSPMTTLCTWWGRELAAHLSTAYADKGDYNRALEITKRSIGNERWKKAYPYYDESEYSRIHLQIGLLYSKKGDSDNAIASYRTALRKNPDDGEAYYRLGEEYERKGVKDLAKENYQSAVEKGFEKAQGALRKLGGSHSSGGK